MGKCGKVKIFFTYTQTWKYAPLLYQDLNVGCVVRR